MSRFRSRRLNENGLAVEVSKDELASQITLGDIKNVLRVALEKLARYRASDILQLVGK